MYAQCVSGAVNTFSFVNVYMHCHNINVHAFIHCCVKEWETAYI